VYEPTISLTGHLGGDPELHYTPNGVPVCDVRLATTPRVKVGDSYFDKETIWFTLSCWREVGEHVAASLKKGDRVVVQGRLNQETYARKDGTSGVKLVVKVEAIGPDLRRCPMELKRPVRVASSAEVMPEMWVDQSTGEVVTARAAGSGPLVPLDDEDALLDEGLDQVAV
jgi:single-strand DNA-binding protein